MHTWQHPRILIVDPDMDFRAELYNFLLSAGYEYVEAAESLHQTLSKISQVAFDFVVLDAGATVQQGLERATRIADLNASAKVILMIRDEDYHAWHTACVQSGAFPVMLKTTFAHNLLYLLEEEL